MVLSSDHHTFYSSIPHTGESPDKRLLKIDDRGGNIIFWGENCLTCAVLFALVVLMASNSVLSEATVHSIHNKKYNIKIPDQMSSTDMSSETCSSMMVLVAVLIRVNTRHNREIFLIMPYSHILLNISLKSQACISLHYEKCILGLI